jgi:cytochrome c
MRRLALALLLLPAAAAQDESPPPDARVIRCVLDGHCRALVVPLGHDVWAAWDTSRGTLLKCWQGDVSWDGPVYTTVHGPQPSSRGDDLLDPLAGAEWSARVGDAETRPVVVFEGYSMPADAAVELGWRLDLPDGRSLRVGETAWLVTDEEHGRPALRRTFTPRPHGAAADVSLTAHGRPAAAARNRLQADGEVRRVDLGADESDAVTGFSLSLALRSDAPTQVRVSYAEPLPPPPPEPEAEAEPADPPTPRMTPDEHRAALLAPPRDLADTANFEPGIALRCWLLETPIYKLTDLVPGQTPNLDLLLRTLDLDGDRGDFAVLGGPTDTFLAQATARLRVDEAGDYTFRLTSDDGSRLYVDNAMLIDHDGLHPPEPREATITLGPGEHELEAWMFEAAGGEVFALHWKTPGAADFVPLPPERLSSPAGVVRVTSPGPKRTVKPLPRTRPGDGEWLAGVHPSFTLHTARPADWEPRVGGLALRDDTLLVSTWDRDGAVYEVTGARGDDPRQIRVRRIASGLSEPLGLCLVGSRLFVLQKQELTELVDGDGDGVTDLYRCACNGWPVTPNFHEFAFGLAERGGWLYANLAVAIDPGGASSQEQATDRGSAIRIHADDGRWEVVARGLRTPNGIGDGADLPGAPADAARPLYVADNQGDWLPSSKVVLLRPGAFYGNRSVLREAADGLVDTPPVAWLPQGEIGNSPSQPVPLPVGPWKGQMLVGDVTYGGLQRIAVDALGDALNGCVVAFSQGLEAGVNRLQWALEPLPAARGADASEDDAPPRDAQAAAGWAEGVGADLFVGGIGSTGNWGQEGKQRFGLQRLRYTGTPAFELLDVRSRADGLLVSFTEPLRRGLGGDPDGWCVQSWRYEPTNEYGGPKVDEREHLVSDVVVAQDGRSAFLRVDGLTAGRVVYVHVLDDLLSSGGRELWAREAWLTLNAVSAEAGPPRAEGLPLNTLTAAQRDDGWQSLFDGTSPRGWHASGAKPLADGRYPAPIGWSVQDGALVRSGSGGDIVSDAVFRDFELELEWRIAEGGNSGIFFLVGEVPRADGSMPSVWETGLEMQVLDDARHRDGGNPLTSAGACYALYAPTRDDTRPIGHWNRVRLVKQGSHVEHWLNGHLQCAYDIGSDDWNARVAASKFKDMPAFGKVQAGHLALQDHGDEVAYRNIRIRDLSY